MKVSKIKLTGKKELSTPGKESEGLVLEESYIMSRAMRDGTAEVHEIDLGPDKVAEFSLEDNTVWICDGGTLHVLFPESDTVSRSGEAFTIPDSIKGTTNDRGILGDVIVTAVKVFSRKKMPGIVHNMALKLEDHHLNGCEGLYQLDVNFELKEIDHKLTAGNFLLFLHGTNSSVSGAFGDMKNSKAWRYMCDAFGSNILGFQHRTLTQSPFQNAVTLAEALPSEAELHLISHSRGGLIGDILCRYDKDLPADQYGFSSSQIEFLQRVTGREEDIKNIKRLNNIFLTKKIKIKKFIRVACPSAGTILASGRMENIFNIISNLTGAFTGPVVSIIRGLISEILKTRDNVNALPGIEAMSPSSPFIQILNDRNDEAKINDRSLIVISGNSLAGNNLRGLAAIATRLFFGQRNDMVVNTDSMYLGVSRSDNILYFFDEGPKVTHTTYFSDVNIQDVLILALKASDNTEIPGFTSVPQLEVPGTDRSFLGLDYGELTSEKPSGKKPVVVIVPGIMGSNLRVNKKRIWINYLQFLTGGLTKLEDIHDERIVASSIVSTSYKKLKDRLSRTYDVVVFPFDWRKQLNECAVEFKNTIVELMKLEQPIKLVGHSMGGVLIRDFIITHNDTWQQLNTSPGFRLLFLGSPLGGSFRIPAVLFGEDSIIDKLSSIDLRHTKKELLTMFTRFPGILSLLPLNKDDENDFAKQETWLKMREAFGNPTWPLPDVSVLEEFKIYRDGILAGREKIDYTNMVYIAGKDKATPCGYYNDMVPPRVELVFLSTGEGDQSVTWETGIPKQLIEKNQVYYVNVTHGALANDNSIFGGIEEILEKGKSDELSTTRPVVRGGESKFRMPRTFDFDQSEPGVVSTLLGLPAVRTPVKSRVPLTVTISSGDLKYASYPVFSGHFKDDSILFAEKSIDKCLHGKLSDRHQLGIYPGEIGTNDIFYNADDVEFKGAVIVGLGEQGTLTAFTLAKTIEQGAANFLLQENNNPLCKESIGMSSIIIGCGFGGLSIESSIRAIIEGVNNANLKMAELFPDRAKRIDHVEFVELYKDKALNCMYALSKILERENALFNIRLGSEGINTMLGAKERLPVDMEESWWNRITVRYKMSQDPSGGVEESLIFGASTADAREEERELFSSTQLINLFIDKMSTQNQWDAESAKTIFELMIPNEFKDRLRRKGNISWVLDKDSASYPWELLQESTLNSKPMCVSGGMIRQLKTRDFSTGIKRVVKDQALVIGDPMLNGFITQLAGAEKEAQEVVSAMNRIGYANTSLIKKNADEIIRNLYSDEYKIIHLAAHGMYNPNQPRKSGVVIGDNLFLNTADIAQMSTIPELVFINCCYLGKVQGTDEQYYQYRYKLAANIGTQLIDMGVKAVVAAGWAVDDAAAACFSKRFYDEMFAGECFGDAVRLARAEVYERYNLTNNTWGAYQCYGDPFYKVVRKRSKSNTDKLKYLIPQQAEIDLDNLISDLESGAADAEYAKQKVKAIMEAVERGKLKNPEIAEKEAIVYGDAGYYDEAVKCYEALFEMENAKFSVSALERHCNLKAKVLLNGFLQNPKSSSAEDYTRKMKEIIWRLEYLLLISQTEERYSLLGSSYKLRAAFAGGKERRSALSAAAFYYQMAYKRSNGKSVYAATNWFIMEALVRFNNKETWRGKEKVDVSRNLFYLSSPDQDTGHSYNLMSLNSAMKKLDEFEKDVMNEADRNNYWQFVGLANIRLCRLILQSKSNKQSWEQLSGDYRTLWRKSGSSAKRRMDMENLNLFVQLISGQSELKDNLKALVESIGEKEVEGCLGRYE